MVVTSDQFQQEDLFVDHQRTGRATKNVPCPQHRRRAACSNLCLLSDGCREGVLKRNQIVFYGKTKSIHKKIMHKEQRSARDMSI